MKEYKKEPDALDELLERALQSDAEPGIACNNLLKSQIRQKEAEKLARGRRKKISLCYLPMIGNLLLFFMTAVMAELLAVTPLISNAIVGFSVYSMLAGIILTILGVRRTNLKENLSITMVQKGTQA